MQAVAEALIGYTQHARAGVVAHALHGRLCRQPRRQRLVETAPPTMVVREHAECFQHLVVLAGAGKVAPFHHLVDLAGEILDSLSQPPPLQLRVVANQTGDHDAGLMQHNVAERDALGDGLAGKTHT